MLIAVPVIPMKAPTKRREPQRITVTTTFSDGSRSFHSKAAGKKNTRTDPKVDPTNPSTTDIFGTLIAITNVNKKVANVMAYN